MIWLLFTLVLLLLDGFEFVLQVFAVELVALNTLFGWLSAYVLCLFVCFVGFVCVVSVVWFICLDLLWFYLLLWWLKWWVGYLFCFVDCCFNSVVYSLVFFCYQFIILACLLGVVFWFALGVCLDLLFCLGLLLVWLLFFVSALGCLRVDYVGRLVW